MESFFTKLFFKHYIKQQLKFLRASYTNITLSYSVITALLIKTGTSTLELTDTYIYVCIRPDIRLQFALSCKNIRHYNYL